MSDADLIRAALTVLHSRLQDEGYAPQVGQPDPEDLFNAALPALKCMEKQVAENAHLREALREIAGMTAEPVRPDGSTCIEVARRALGEEALTDVDTIHNVKSHSGSLSSHIKGHKA